MDVIFTRPLSVTRHAAFGAASLAPGPMQVIPGGGGFSQVRYTADPVAQGPSRPAPLHPEVIQTSMDPIALATARECQPLWQLFVYRADPYLCPSPTCAGAAKRTRTAALQLGIDRGRTPQTDAADAAAAITKK
jgi:hypothetical protein